MESVLLSVRPKWCGLIANGEKTIEVRKTKPKLETPFKCYIYCTKPSKKYQTVAGSMVLNDDELFKLPNGEIKYGNSIELIAYDNYSKDNFLNGKVIGEFVCDCIDAIYVVDNETVTYIRVNGKPDMFIVHETCLKVDELQQYLNNKTGYGWHISNLMIYDRPKELGEFKKLNRKCWWADLGLAKRDCPECRNEECYVSRPPQSWCYVEGTIYCKNCKHLMFSDCYAECGKAYKGIVSIDDFCDKGELR